MFDNVSKFLAENFSEDYATWLLGRPVTFTKLSPTELSLEPIRRVRGNLMTAASVFGGLVLKPELIKTILRSEIMKESAVYQEILQEGEQRGLLKGEQIGLLKGKLETIPLLIKLGLTIAEIAEELDIDIALVDQFVANQNH
ncbi:MAG: hypothetical protein ACKO5Q_14195 [Microcystaceae cyanobacterium]